MLISSGCRGIVLVIPLGLELLCPMSLQGFLDEVLLHLALPDGVGRGISDETL